MKNRFSRRSLFQGAVAAVAASNPLRGAQAAAPAVIGASNTEVRSVERIWVDLPYRPVPKRHMHRERPGWTLFEVTKATLENGVVGFGESMVQYGGRPLGDSIIQRIVGRPAPESMWDDSIGYGLQIALFDAVGKTNDVPIHRLLGRKVRDRAFLSWWACDQPGEDWVIECRDAMARGYTAFKAKARSWFDLYQQCETLTPTLPEHFRIDFDFNSLLLDSGHAGPYLTGLEKFRHLAIFESPIPQTDVEGNKLLRTKTRIPIAMHFGSPPIMTALREEVCDGFVIGGGASRVIENGTIAAVANKPFWLQLVGTGITATWGMHLAAVLSHARWPAINCNHLFEEELVKPRITLANGTAAIPEAPGLGVGVGRGSRGAFSDWAPAGTAQAADRHPAFDSLSLGRDGLLRERGGVPRRFPGREAAGLRRRRLHGADQQRRQPHVERASSAGAAAGIPGGGAADLAPG